MSKTKTNIIDDIVEAGREVLREIEEALNPKKRRKPAPVPIPVRKNYPQPDHNERNY